MYCALYRKYRPVDFESVVGQDNIIMTLKNSILNHSFSHAYMFFGSRGTGKTTVSKIFARSVNCLNPVDGSCCGKCANCLVSIEKECVDIIEIDAASNNGVDEIRELRNKISLVPAELKYKVYIIDEVHMLSIGAFNALLKTLEEPPEHAIFILATTDPQKVPETIISRCQSFSFKRISDNSIVERLKYVCNQEKITIDDEVLVEIAKASAGGLRDALGLLDKLHSYKNENIKLSDFYDLNGMVDSSMLQKLCLDIFEGNISNLLSTIDQLNNCGKNIIQVTSQLMYYLRDIVVDYYINNIKYTYDINVVQKFINLLNDKLFEIKKSSDAKIYIEMLFLKFINANISDSQNISREINTQEKSKLIVDQPENIPTDNVSVEPAADIDITQKNDFESYNSDYPTVVNIDEIMKVRINNTLASADKNLLKYEQKMFEIFNDYTFDSEIGYIACGLLDASIRAVSPDNVILSYEYDSTVKQSLLNIKFITYIYNKLTNSNKNLVFITDNEWNKIKNDYILCIKNGGNFSVKDEPLEELLEVKKNDDIISNSAIELFGDIVEID